MRMKKPEKREVENRGGGEEGKREEYKKGGCKRRWKLKVEE